MPFPDLSGFYIATPSNPRQDHGFAAALEQLPAFIEAANRAWAERQHSGTVAFLSLMFV